MTLHNIEIHELPKNIRKNFEKFMKNKNKKASKDPTSPKSGSKTLSTSRKPVKHKINTEISHVPVVGGDMITLRNKDKKVNIKKGLENSLLDSLSSKSKSNTRNKDKSKSSKAEISLSNGGDSLKALDELMGVPAPKKVDNSFILKKHNIKFKALRGGGLKRKSRKRDRVSENAEKQVLNKSKPLKQSRNIIMESFGPADFS